MLVRALRSFSGPAISMTVNEIRDIPADEVKHLIRAGNVEQKEKQVKSDESKRSNSTKR